MAERAFTATIHDEGEGTLWAEILELPGCFATGDNRDELLEALAEAIALHVGHPVHGATWQSNSAHIEQVGILIDA